MWLVNGSSLSLQTERVILATFKEDGGWIKPKRDRLKHRRRVPEQNFRLNEKEKSAQTKNKHLVEQIFHLRLQKAKQTKKKIVVTVIINGLPFERT